MPLDKSARKAIALAHQDAKAILKRRESRLKLRRRALRGHPAPVRLRSERALRHFCRYCGVASFYRPRVNPENYMINARCLEGVDLDSLELVRFDGRSWEMRPDAPYTGIWKV